MPRSSSGPQRPQFLTASNIASNAARVTGAGGVSVRVIGPPHTADRPGPERGPGQVASTYLRAGGRGEDGVDIVRGDEDQARIADGRQRILQPVIHVEIADDVVVEGVEIEDGEEVHRLVLLHVDHLHRAVLDRVEEVTAGLVRGDDDLAGLAGLGDGADDAGPGLGIEADHAGQIRDGPG